MTRSDNKRLSHRVDLNLLELFEATYRHRNLTLAGAELGLSQPAMSRSLARLRHAYGDQLFVRTPEGLVPTPFGEALYQSACSVLEIVRRSLEEATFDPPTARRTFRVAMSDTGEQVFLPRLARAVASEAPHVRLQAVPVSTGDLPAALASGKVDLAMGFFRLNAEALYQQRLFDAHYACVARRDHPRIARKLTLAQYRELGHVITTYDATAHAVTVRNLLESPAVRARIALYVSHFLSIGPIVAETDYIATIPRNLARTFEAAWGVKMHDPPVKLPAYDVTQYWHARFHQEPGIVWLRQHVKRLFSGK